MYGNRDGIVEGSIQDGTRTHAATTTIYYAKEYTYDAATDRFTLKDPIALLGTEVTEDYVGWYASTSLSYSFIYKVTSVNPSDGSSNASIGYSYVRYGTTSKEKAQTNTNDSNIKEAIDEWYENHIKGTVYEQYLSDTLFCNDRSLALNANSSYSQFGYGPEPTVYRTSYDSGKKTLNCQQQNDRFTVNDEITGNGDLTYPIGLITSDDFYLAGGLVNTNNNRNYNFYLYTGNYYWTMSPSNYRINQSNINVMLGTYLGANYSGINNGVRPVINLKPNSLNTGDGTASNPYQIQFSA